MSPSTETIKLLNHNLNTLNFVLAPAQRNAMTDEDRGTVLRTLRATAEAGAKLAEVVHMDAVRAGGVEMGQKKPATKDAAVLEVEQGWDEPNSSPDTKKAVAGRYRMVPSQGAVVDGW